MLKAIVLMSSVMCAVACEQTENTTVRPKTGRAFKTQISLDSGEEFRGQSGILLSPMEPREAGDGQAEVGVSSDGTTGIGITALVPASYILEASWEAVIAPQGMPGVEAAASLTLTRSENDWQNAESGRITFERDGGTVSGRANVKPDSLDLTFSGSIWFECFRKDGEGGGTRDDALESAFCQRFAGLVQDIAERK